MRPAEVVPDPFPVPDAVIPPRVLLIAPHNSYRIAPFLAAARTQGADILVVSEGRHSLVGAVADGLHVDFAMPEVALAAIVQEGRRRPFSGIVATDDHTVELAARVARKFDLPHNSPEAARLSRRKDLARARLAAAGVPVPDHRRVDLGLPLDPQIQGVAYPCVIKPLSLSASRGVIRADGPEALRAAAERVRRIVVDLDDPGERGQALIESYVPGFEVAVEGLLTGGRFQPLALFDKPDPLEGPYFEETYYITPSRLSEQAQALVYRRVAEACDAYGLREGPVHAELRLHAEESWILEVASRTIGGECARLLRFGTGKSLEELVLEHALGEQPELRPEIGGAGVLMIPIPRAGVLRRVEGLFAARRVPYVESVEINVQTGYELVPLPEGNSYLGFIFARAPSAPQAEAALRAAHACLNFVTAPVFRLA